MNLLISKSKGLRLLKLDTIERFLSSGQVFLPINAENKGDSVQVYFKDGSIELLDMQPETFLAQILCYFSTSIVTNRKRYGKMLGKKQLIPIALSYGLILVPFHVREAIGRQTRCGWFIAKEISFFYKKSSHVTFIQLANHEISVMHSERFCMEQLKNARYIEFCYGELHEPYRKNWQLSTG